MLIDLHTHTSAGSWDSKLTPDDLVDCAKRAGLDGVCLTEHDAFWEQHAVDEIRRRHGFLVLPGIEMNTEDGHMLVFGIDRYEFGMHRLAELAGHVERAQGAIVMAHPYRRQLPWYIYNPDDYTMALDRAALNPAYGHVTALEAINGRAKPIENEFSRDLIERVSMPSTAGSDAHGPEDVGRCATRFERRIDSLADLIAELRAGRVEAVDLTAAETDRGG